MPAELTPADPLPLPDDVPLSEGESGYVAAARAANTLRAYRSDWAEWCTWCSTRGIDPLVGDPSPRQPVPGRPGPGRGQRADHVPAAFGPALRLPVQGHGRPHDSGQGHPGVGGHPPYPRRPG